MKESGFHRALVRGYEQVSAWANVLDRINVFPVADGDTGRNLVVSLAPIRRTDLDVGALINALLMCARGNSGNIGARFFEGFLSSGQEATSGPEGRRALRERVRQGRELAWTSVSDPLPGTMLSLFDALESALEQLEPQSADDGAWVEQVLGRLEQAVRDTPQQLPVLAQAGVVDAGALGMFLFFDGFIQALAGGERQVTDVARLFPEMVAYAPGMEPTPETGFCVDAVLHTRDLQEDALARLLEQGSAAVSFCQGEYVKVHLHTDDRARVREELEQIGDVVRWAWDDLDAQTRSFSRPAVQQALHIMTDAAGSITQEDAERLGITLLHSYVSIADLSIPESHLQPPDLYRAMSQATPVSTAQASDHERHLHYDKVLALYPRVLYLCVGSVFTGNYEAVTRWKRQHDPEERMTVVDTAAASGKLGIIALATARQATTASSAEAVLAFARQAVEAAQEFVFLDKLQFLAAGGRLSKTSAFFGDLLHMKPVVSPTAEGAKKVAVVRNTKDQISFAMERLEEILQGKDAGLIMLQYTDNLSFLQQRLLPMMEARFPAAEILLQPMSLTSGAHMGPGTWGVAVLPEIC